MIDSVCLENRATDSKDLFSKSRPDNYESTDQSVRIFIYNLLQMCGPTIYGEMYVGVEIKLHVFWRERSDTQNLPHPTAPQGLKPDTHLL